MEDGSGAADCVVTETERGVAPPGTRLRPHQPESQGARQNYREEAIGPRGGRDTQPTLAEDHATTGDCAANSRVMLIELAGAAPGP